jgi:hypothetical protein
MLVHRPRGLPTWFEDALTRAEGLFWLDYIAAGRVVRNLIEEVLADGTARGVPESRMEGTKEALNGPEVTMDNLLDAFDLLGELTRDPYGSRG